MTAERLSRIAQADLLLWVANLLAAPDAGDLDLAADLDQVAAVASRAGLRDGSPVFEALVRLACLVDSTTAAQLAVEHTRLFDGATACPPNETAWVRRDKGAILGDISGFYLAFGFELADGVGEKADHVVAELQFAALLLVMLARAEEKGEREQARLSLEALESFAQDHLDAWLGAFCDRLGRTSSLALDRTLAGATEGVWELVCASNGLPRADRPAAAEPRPDEPLDALACGLDPAPGNA